VRIKIYGRPSVQGGESLCDTCRMAHVVRGRRVDEELVFCQATAPMQPVRITFRVAVCSEYIDAREPSYAELVEQAWVLTPASRRRPAGFVRASDLKGDEAARIFSDPTEPD
jgi:hypothetical protein